MIGINNPENIPLIDLKVNIFVDFVMRILIVAFAVAGLFCNTEIDSYVMLLLILIFSLVEITIKAVVAIDFFFSNYVRKVHNYNIVITNEPPEDTMYQN